MEDLANTTGVHKGSPFNKRKPMQHLWQRFAVMLFSGALASLALPPLGLWPALFIAFPVLLLALDNISQRPSTRAQKFKAAFLSGWAFGFGYFVISLYWIGAAFLVEADKFALLLPLAVAALPAGLAIFWGLASGVAILLWKINNSRVLTFAIAFTAFEWLRGHLFTGFPWNTIGYSSAGMGGIDQLAAFSGLYGVTFIVLIWALTPVLLFSKRPHYPLVGCLMSLMAVVWLWGQSRAHDGHKSRAESASQSRLMVRVVQPNIIQEKKWDRAFRKDNIDRYFKLSSAKPLQTSTGKTFVDVVVWPESALPLLYEESENIQQRVASLLPAKTYLLLGALRRQKQVNPETNKRAFFNSLLTVDSNGKVIATYDKSHLVPFGEYLPAEKWLAPLGLRKIVALPASFSAGTGPKTFKIGQLPTFSAYICYEIGFSDELIGQNKRPKWIVNVTNDGWFGKTAGPHQHLAQTQFRAIEQGLPIVRAANTGISAMIDPFGNIVKSLALGQAGYFDVRLPQALPATIYARFGYWALIAQVALIWILFTAISRLFARPGRR